VAGEYELRALNGPRADIAALILGGREAGSLRATALAVVGCALPTAANTGLTSAEVRLGVEAEATSLLEAVASGDQSDVPDSVRIELYVYAMTQAGEIVDHSSRWVRLSLTDLAGQLPGGGVKLVDRFDLPPGEYQLRVLVREARSQQFALRVFGVVVADSGDQRISLTQPLFHDEASWLVAASDNAPLSLASALPVLVAGKPRAFALRGCHLGGAAFAARLLTRQQQPVAGAHIRFGSAEEVGVGQRVDAEIEPGELEAGLYQLEVSASSSSGAATQTLPVFITGAEGISTWTALGGLTAEPEAEDEELDLASASGSSKRIRTIERSYRKALDLLASGRLAPALTALEKLEREVLEAHDNPRKALKWLTEAQNRVTRDLLRQDPECLLPLLMLHLELHGRYVAPGNVSSHLLYATRTRIRSLAQVYSTDARQDMAPALAAMSLVDLAAVLERSGQLISALIVLREGLALDRSNTDLLLDLAYQYEHHGFRPEALDLLRRLLELDPRSDEGRLRLAMNLRRAQRRDPALTLLRQLIDNGSSEWVLAVAYQELGHDLLSHERFDEAADLLEGAVRRLPRNQRLHIELAYALDRVGRRNDSRQVIAGLPADRGQSSPRLLYRIPDRREDLQSRRDLLRHGTARLPLLAAALSGSEGD
jgi:tetratricopeptide (TPR) repeat protein